MPERKVNTFEGGMVQDVSSRLNKDNVYYHSKHGRLIYNDNGTFSWSNARGNHFSFELDLFHGCEQEYINKYPKAQIIGWVECRDKLILFISCLPPDHAGDAGSHSEIGAVYYDNDNENHFYETVFNDAFDPNGDRLNFSVNHPIEATYVYENPDIERIYWTDDEEVPRAFNLKIGENAQNAIAPYTVGNKWYRPSNCADLYPSFYSAHDMDLQSQVWFGPFEFVRTVNGSLTAGMYQYTYRYGNHDGNFSSWYALSTHLFLTSEEVNDENWHQYFMSTVGQDTSKGIELVLKGVDARWQVVQFAYVYSESPDQILNANIFGIHDITDADIAASRITIAHTENTGIPMDITEILSTYESIEKVKTLKIKDERLFFGNVEVTPTIGLTFEQIGQINITPKYRLTNDDEIYGWRMVGDKDSPSTSITHQNPKGVDNPVFLNKTLYDGTINQLEVNNDYVNYKGMQVEHSFKGYFRGETYRFGIVFFDLTGQPSLVQHIGDFTFPEQSSTVWTKALSPDINNVFNTGNISNVPTLTRLSGLDSNQNPVDEDNFISPNAITWNSISHPSIPDENTFVGVSTINSFLDGLPMDLTGVLPASNEGAAGNTFELKNPMLRLQGIDVSNIDISDINDQISGFAIVRAKRDETIIAQGLIQHAVENRTALAPGLPWIDEEPGGIFPPPTEHSLHGKHGETSGVHARYNMHSLSKVPVDGTYDVQCLHNGGFEADYSKHEGYQIFFGEKLKRQHHWYVFECPDHMISMGTGGDGIFSFLAEGYEVPTNYRMKLVGNAQNYGTFGPNDSLGSHDDHACHFYTKHYNTRLINYASLDGDGDPIQTVNSPSETTTFADGTTQTIPGKLLGPGSKTLLCQSGESDYAAYLMYEGEEINWSDVWNNDASTTRIGGMWTSPALVHNFVDLSNTEFASDFYSGGVAQKMGWMNQTFVNGLNINTEDFESYLTPYGAPKQFICKYWGYDAITRNLYQSLCDHCSWHESDWFNPGGNQGAEQRGPRFAQFLGAGHEGTIYFRAESWDDLRIWDDLCKTMRLGWELADVAAFPNATGTDRTAALYSRVYNTNLGHYTGHGYGLEGATQIWPIVNLIYEGKIPYGGVNETSLSNTVYEFTGTFVPVNQNLNSEFFMAPMLDTVNEVEVFGGDCFLGFYDYARILPWWIGHQKAISYRLIDENDGYCGENNSMIDWGHDGGGAIAGHAFVTNAYQGGVTDAFSDIGENNRRTVDMAHGMVIPIESKYNHNMRYDENRYANVGTKSFAEYSAYIEDSDSMDFTFAGGLHYYRKNCEGVDLQYELQTFDYAAILDHYETEYFYTPKSIMAPATIPFDYPVRWYYSNKKRYGDVMDAFREFPAIQYIDLDGAHGEITSSALLFSYLYSYQESGYGRLRINERTILKAEAGAEVILGNPDILTGIDYISTEYGNQHQWGLCTSDKNAYWIDISKAKVLRHGQDGLVILSDANGLHEWITSKSRFFIERDNPIGFYTTGLYTIFDFEHGDVYFSTRRFWTDLASIEHVPSDRNAAATQKSGGKTVKGAKKGDRVLIGDGRILDRTNPKKTGKAKAVREQVTEISSLYFDEETLLYNENIDAFTTFYLRAPKIYFRFGKSLFAPDPGHNYNLADYPVDSWSKNVYLYNGENSNFGSFFNIVYGSALTFFTNVNHFYSKVFDNQYYSANPVIEVMLTNVAWETETTGSNIIAGDERIRYREELLRMPTRGLTAGTRLRGKRLRTNMNVSNVTNLDLELSSIETLFRYIKRV